MFEQNQKIENDKFNIPAELKKLPGKPGVYIMKNSVDDVIYVGKAVNLKNRVKQYFQSNSGHTPKVKVLVSKIDHFEYIVTDTEFEALILECNLIKKYRPKYNVKLKDDKHFPYIKVTINEDYPKVMMSRRISDDGAKYFGPYLNVHSIHDTLHELRIVFPLKSCKKELPREIGKSRPCLNYHIGLCMGPCAGEISREEYQMSIKDICVFLEGKQDDIVHKIEKDMMTASEEMKFEMAAKLRDKLFALQHIQEKQKVLSTAQYDQDVIAYSSDNVDACIAVFFIRGGKLVGREQYIFAGSVKQDSKTLLTEFVKQFYMTIRFIPKEIILQEPIDDLQLIEELLKEQKGEKVHIHVPVRGEKLSMVRMVEKNAQVELVNKKETFLAEESAIQAGLQALSTNLSICFQEESRIEAYDVSNFGQNEKVASMVVFKDGRPSKQAYRRFKIKWVEGQDDYACMQEALMRRLTNMINKKANFSQYPDLILVDGGKGHVSAALEVVRELKLDIPVAGMAKDDKHNTNALVTVQNEEIPLKGVPDLFRLISAIQDEAHRFAIDYSKKLAERKISLSELDEIRGIGKKRKMALLTALKSFKNIKAATVEALMAVPGIDEKTAGNIFNHFNREI